MDCPTTNFLLFILLLTLTAIGALKVDNDEDWVAQHSLDHHKWELKINQDSDLCETWRFGVEANNVRDWKKIPSECISFVQNYMEGSHYSMDSSLVANESIAYADSLVLSLDGKDVWVFDVDETLLSNLPYYQAHNFGAEDFDDNLFNEWVDLADAPALSASHRLYTHLLGLGIKVFLLTGRDEGQRNATSRNLIQAGYHTWEELLLRGPNDHGKTATVYKSERRFKIEENGFRIWGNSGDQWSDLSGYSTGHRTFKLPNPMYYIA